MSVSRCTSVELSLSVVAYFFSNKIENDKLKEPGFPSQNAIYVSHFLTCVLLFLIATFRLKKKPESSYSFLLLCFDFPHKKE